jgi:phospholipid/cholesterol/gamma-HCH transport system substrate-binding protein
MPRAPSALTRGTKEESHISPHGSTTEAPGRRPGQARRSSSGRGSRPTSAGARIAAWAALGIALVVVALIVLGGGGSYTVTADFQDASGLVSGDEVLVGPAQAGTIGSIGLTRGGAAAVMMSLDGDLAPLHQGTTAHIVEDSLSGIADHYVELEPGSANNPSIADGGVIGEGDTYSEVGIDELFDTFDPLTRAGLSNFIRGEAASLKGRGQAANRALQYLAPGLQSTDQVAAELTRDEPAFDSLVVQGARALQALASRSRQLSQLIANTSAATGAIARQSRALTQALTLFPGTLTRSTTTFAGLDTTLDALGPLVAASQPAARRLPTFLTRLRPLISEAIPTIAQLDDLIHNPSAAGGDLTTLALRTPALERTARAAFPRLIAQFTQSQAQIAYLREYAPDVVAALTNLGQAGAYYDANGHYVRTQPALFPFALTGANQLTTQFPSQRYDGLQVVHDRCPGSAVQPAPDGSAPQAVPGCSTTSVPSGP